MATAQATKSEVQVKAGRKSREEIESLSAEERMINDLKSLMRRGNAICNEYQSLEGITAEDNELLTADLNGWAFRMIRLFNRYHLGRGNGNSQK